MTQSTTPQARTVRPGRLRRVLPLLVTVWLVLEIWLLTVVASVTGWLTVFLLLVAGVFVGGSVIKRAGVKALSAALEQSRRTVESGPQPQQPQTGTSLKVLGGVLLMVPGFLSDLLGLSLLFPPTRVLWRAAGRRATRSALRSAGLADAVRLQQQLRIHRPDGKVIPGEVVDQSPSGGPGEQYPPIDR